MATKDPIYVVGGARSGTTILAKLFDSHPDILYRHEPDSVLSNSTIPHIPRHDEIEALIPAAGAYLDALCHVRSSKVSGRLPVFDKSYRSKLRKTEFEAAIFLAKVLERVSIAFGVKHVSVPDFIDHRAANRLRYLIKSVDVPWRTPLYSRARPAWHYIHIVRHPCAVLLSKLAGIELNLMSNEVYYRTAFEAGMVTDYPFTLKDIEGCSFEEKVAFGWMICNQRISDDMTGQDNYLQLRYEDLCRDMTGVTKQLFEFVDLTFDQQTQEFLAHLDASDAGSGHYFDVIRSPKGSIDKWRRGLSSQQIDRVERMVSFSAIGRDFFENI